MKANLLETDMSPLSNGMGEPVSVRSADVSNIVH